MSIVFRLDSVMAYRKMPLNELARRIGMTDSNLSILKTGKARAVRVETLGAICRELQCQPGDILEYRPDEPTADTAGSGQKTGPGDKTLIKQPGGNIMTKTLQTLAFIICLTAVATAVHAGTKSPDGGKHRFFVGSSFFMLGNLSEESPDYFRLDLGYKMTSKDFIIIQPLTWRYPGPIGIPYTSPAFGKGTVKYPGYVRSVGLGLGYNRVLWKGLFTAVYATPFRIGYYDPDNRLIQAGVQLFLQFQLNYRFELFNKVFYIEPGLTCNYWPVNTNMPGSFKAVEAGWPNYFLFEPVFNFGFNFSF